MLRKVLLDIEILSGIIPEYTDQTVEREAVEALNTIKSKAVASQGLLLGSDDSKYIDLEAPKGMIKLINDMKDAAETLIKAKIVNLKLSPIYADIKFKVWCAARLVDEI